MLLELEAFFVTHFVRLVATLHGMDLKEWAAVLSIGWVLYQFIDKRRLSEANIDKYFEQHFVKILKGVEDQRRTYLEELASAQRRLALHAFLIMCLAYVSRFLWFLWRIVRLRFKHTSAAHAMLHFESGQLGDAKNEFLKTAEDLLNTASLYKKQASAKRQEAVNALIFAGRVAALQGDAETTINSFHRALKIRNADLDARKFIGEQFWAAGNLTAALEQFDEIATSNAAKRDKARAAEARRLQSDVLVERGDTQGARDALEASLALEKERQSFEGMAETQEKLGDTFVNDKRTLEEARNWYSLSLENYLTTSDKKAISRLRRKLTALRSEDTFWSKLAEQLGEYLIEKVARRLRVPAQTP